MATQQQTKESFAASELGSGSAVRYQPSALSQTRSRSSAGIGKALRFSTRPAVAWVWPLTAAIVMGGSILFWSLAGLFWLAARPTQPPIVIRMVNPTAQADAGYAFEYDNEQRSGDVVAEAIR